VDETEQLDYVEFCKLIREREVGYEHTELELTKRFEELDKNGNGMIDMDEYLAYALRDSLSRSADQVCSLFSDWDEDGTGWISKQEFRRAIKGFGFDCRRRDIDSFFDQMDSDGSGQIDFIEMERHLRGGSMYGSGYEIRRIKDAGLPPVLQLDPNSSVIEQLKSFLAANATRVIDLFREWDDDGDGVVSKKNFRRAMPLLGLHASRVQIDSLFDIFDLDSSGYIAYEELNAQLRKRTAMPAALAKPWVAGAVQASPLLETARELLAAEYGVPSLPNAHYARHNPKLDDAHWLWMMPMKGSKWMRQPAVAAPRKFTRALPPLSPDATAQ